MKRHLVLFAAGLAALPLLSCRHAPPAGVAAEVNGHAITFAELEKIYQTQYPQPVTGASEDTLQSQRLDLLNKMVTNEILLQRAEQLGLTAVDSDVETELNKIKAPYTKEEFEKWLTERHMTLADLKAQLRRELTVSKLINKEITSKITITDADVENFYKANKASFNLAEPTIHLAQILVTPTPDSNVRNLKNSKAQNEKEAVAKTGDIYARLQRGEDFAMLAQSYSEDPNSAPNGGDMGPIPVSALEKVGPELRKVIASLQPGSISQPIPTSEGFRLFKLISREPAGQRELNDPRVQQDIRDLLLNRKDQLLQAAYYETQRNNAKVQNYLASGIVGNTAKK
jgi:peptidyl-prolyl cis-trans isomerase SurA